MRRIDLSLITPLTFFSLCVCIGVGAAADTAP